ncbi:TonB-dependent receptor [Sphingobacterium bovistauri]|uniref:Outer membrane beta-barrel protein n=1 Tax=Sphingobacterium bovistauri TaxID=2781959 RepID=A0ABS7Z2H4_9SPHI|nr:TonB-dependent receptor [Sphingobacterium bovistauri]MCA5003656.1 outer membrane beta-barrel protein [Sphingobacterium bovistauri]
MLVTTNLLFAQNQILGVVKDSLNLPIKDVIVRFYTPNDSITHVTNSSGVYRFNLSKSEDVTIRYSMLGYEAQEKKYKIDITQKSFVLPDIILNKVAFRIEDVSVTRVIPMILNGDTIQYNFGAFTFRKQTLLEDGLKKIPGFHISRDGSVYYNGNQIKKVKVNNNEFFGGDIITATKNLPVDYINNIQLIELQTTSQGGETGIADFQEKEKLLNINLKEDKKILHFGQFTIGAGTNSRYLGSFGFNRFNDGNELSILGSFNNTNTNLFSYGDIVGGKRSANNLEMSEFIDPIDGINTTSSVGINLANRVGKNSRLTTSYNYIKKNTITSGYSEMRSSYIGNTISKSENYDQDQTDDNQRFKVLFDGKLENADILKVEGNLTFNTKSVINNKESVLSNFQKVNKGIIQDSAKHNIPTVDIDVLYSKYFKKKDRKLVGKFNSRSNSLKNKQFVRENYSVYSKNVIDYTDELNHQFINHNNNNASSNLSLSFVEPFLNNSLFEFKYELDYNKINARRYVYNWMKEDEMNIIDSLTMDYGYKFRSNKIGVIYQFAPSKRLKFNIGFAVQPIKMSGDLGYDTLNYNYENINLIPTTNFSYKLSNNVDFQISYKGRNNQPSFYQIAPVLNNTNSRNIVLGNPELKAELAHGIVTTFRAFLPVKMQYLETNFSYNLIKDKIVTDKRPVENSTIQKTTFRNANGYYDWKWNYIFNTPFENDNWMLDLNGGVDYYNNISFIEDRERTTKQLIFNQSIQLKYSFNNYLESIFNTNYSLNNASYDIPYRTKINVETLFLGLGAKGYVKDNYSLGFEMSQRYNDGYISKFMNVNQTMMNAFMEYTFLQNRTALLRLQVYDLFDQNKQMGIYSEYIGNDVFEERKNRLGRYFMLSLNIRMQK